MRLNFETRDDVRVITLGEPRLDASNARVFRDAVLEQVEKGGEKFVLDMSPVTFVDSTGLGAIVGVIKNLGRNRVLELCSLTPTVLKVFKLTRMDKVFRIHPSAEAAHIALSAQSPRASA